MAIKSLCYLGEDDEILFFHSTEKSDELSSRFSVFASLDNLKKLSRGEKRREFVQAELLPSARVSSGQRPAVATPFKPHATLTACNLNHAHVYLPPRAAESSEKKADPYVGYIGVNLSLFSAYKNYAYVVKAINLKIILTIDDGKNKYTDDILKSVFIKLHKIYVDAVCNPFYTDLLESDSFEKKISNSFVLRKKKEKERKERKGKKKWSPRLWMIHPATM
ncbi:hypothetical protein PCYB_052510, partial [Plasmodium cynomolgi strain B]